MADAAGAATGATVYVSLEPCAFAGRTPACTGALMEAGVDRVVVAMVDPHPQVSGEGIAALRRAGIDVDVHELPEAQTLNVGYNQPYYARPPMGAIEVGAVAGRSHRHGFR